MIGGWICDKYEPKYPGIKGYVSAGGAFMGAIFIILTFYIKTSFALSMVFYYFEYLFAEVFFGPSYAQINKLISSQMQGLAVAVFMLCGATSGSLFTFLLGVFGDKYDTNANPQLQGKILTYFVCISYFGCIPFFLLNSKEYAKNLKYQEILTSYVAIQTKRKMKRETEIANQ
jgi:MFS family permease